MTKKSEKVPVVTMKHIPITLGHMYKDIVSGYSGWATGYWTDMDGCAHVLLVTPDPEKADGKAFAANRMEAVEHDPLPLTAETQKPSTIELGRRYRDDVTGFEGVATSRYEALEGYTHVVLNPKIGKDGKLISTQSFDEARLIDVETKTKPGTKAPSGPSGNFVHHHGPPQR